MTDLTESIWYQTNVMFRAELLGRKKWGAVKLRAQRPADILREDEVSIHSDWRGCGTQAPLPVKGWFQEIIYAEKLMWNSQQKHWFCGRWAFSACLARLFFGCSLHFSFFLLWFLPYILYSYKLTSSLLILTWSRSVQTLGFWVSKKSLHSSWYRGECFRHGHALCNEAQRLSGQPLTASIFNFDWKKHLGLKNSILAIVILTWWSMIGGEFQ